jgi:tRNA dimethylallyltransferase
MTPKIVVILGPTGVGKSETALELCKETRGEIVSADSQQVYRYLDIGTGKPAPSDRSRIRHHVIDVVDPDEEFNAAMFRDLATSAIKQIHGRRQIAVVCGGTGLYLKVLTRGLFHGPGSDPELRRKLQCEIDKAGLASLYRRLAEIDPTARSTIHPNDRQRTIRAVETYELTGKPLSYWQREHAFQEERFRALKIGLNRERDELYELINKRCDRMIEEGLLEEVRELVLRGYSVDLKPLRSVGYFQMGRVLRGIQKLSDAVEEMKGETRHLAKRQLTWFRADREIHWYHPSQRREIFEAVDDFLMQR